VSSGDFDFDLRSSSSTTDLEMRKFCDWVCDVSTPFQKRKEEKFSVAVQNVNVCRRVYIRDYFTCKCFNSTYGALSLLLTKK